MADIPPASLILLLLPFQLDFHRGLLAEHPTEVKADEALALPGMGPAVRGEREMSRRSEAREREAAVREQWAEREREMERRERTRAEREWDRDKVREGPRSRSRSRERRRKERPKSKEKKAEKKGERHPSGAEGPSRTTLKSGLGLRLRW